MLDAVLNRVQRKQPNLVGVMQSSLFVATHLLFFDVLTTGEGRNFLVEGERAAFILVLCAKVLLDVELYGAFVDVIFFCIPLKKAHGTSKIVLKPNSTRK